MSKRKIFNSICECHMDHVLLEDLPEGKINCECHECSDEARILYAQFLRYELLLARQNRRTK